MNRRILLQSIVLMPAVSSILAPAIPADGGKAKNDTYYGQAQPGTGTGNWQFNIDTSPIIFYLGTVNNKYHALLIRVRSNTDAPLSLAKDQDTIELRFSGQQRVKGLLNLPAVDPATWDSLDQEIRTAVAYPDIVQPREEEGIYCYVPVGDVTGPRKRHEMPSSIIYNIKSISNPVELRPRGVAAA